MRQKSSMGSYRRGQLIFVWSMIIIPIIGWFIFFVYVNASSFVQAFQDVNGNFTWYNFEQVFASFRGDIDGRGGLGIAMRNTFSYFGQHIILIFPLQIIMAYFFYKQIPDIRCLELYFICLILFRQSLWLTCSKNLLRQTDLSGSCVNNGEFSRKADF